MKNLLILFFLLPVTLLAQKTHTVGPKETLFSIGRMYEVHPRELANFNKISFDDGVKIGQVLRIPEKKAMTPVAEKTASPVVVTPPAQPSAPVVTSPATAGSKAVYHVVQKGESLFQISRKYDGATVANLKKWNKLGDEGLKEGQKLIVGYQATNTDEKPVVAVTEKPKAQLPVKAEPVVTAPVVTAPAVATPVPAPATTAVKENTKPGDGGYFKSLFIVQSRAAGSPKTENGQAAVFKSNSGWDDGKYYCLYNAAPAGTILKITNPGTQKFVYAKVLDVIPDVQQNEGVVIRLSNSAAAELGASGEKFQVALNYQ